MSETHIRFSKYPGPFDSPQELKTVLFLRDIVELSTPYNYNDLGIQNMIRGVDYH